MSGIELRALDLNLLVALDALLQEQSVTRAARRVGVGQSAMSHSLRRLRELVGDPLLVRVGRQMRPTPRAERLAGPLRQKLGELQRLLGDEGGFDPETSTRRFRLVCSDLLASFLPALLARMRASAPGVTLEVRLPTRGVADALLTEGGADDLGLGPSQPDTPGLKQRGLGRIDWVVLARGDHPVSVAGLTRASWTRYPHVLVRTGNASANRVAGAILGEGLERRIGLVVPSFLMAPYAVSETDLLYTAPRQLVAKQARQLGLAVLEPPVALPWVTVFQVWPERLGADAAHRWLRDVVAEVVRATLAPGGPGGGPPA